MGPIKNITEVNLMKATLKKNNFRDYLIFLIGINTGMKSKNLISLKVSDLFYPNKIPKDYIIIEEVPYKINNLIKKEVLGYLETTTIGFNDFLFKSYLKTNSPINRSHFYRILNQCHKNGKIGNEDLRKTFGYHYFNKTNDLQLLKKIFKNKTKSQLYKYLEISDKEDFNFEL